MRAKGGPNLNAWLVSVVLSFTVLMSVSLGVIAAYGMVSVIFFAFRTSHAQPEAKPVLLARNAQAGAD
jgi:hypothetical protein